MYDWAVWLLKPAPGKGGGVWLKKKTDLDDMIRVKLYILKSIFHDLDDL